MATPSAGRDSANIPNASQGDNRNRTEFSDTLRNDLAGAWKSVAPVLTWTVPVVRLSRAGEH
ncbi:hypothetical protein PSAB6_330049 [Paraburkholderia sabiae]|nr:hypothetical protein PSAB6_330049 [Paraburkholderia sabiae]